VGLGDAWLDPCPGTGEARVRVDAPLWELPLGGSHKADNQSCLFLCLFLFLCLWLLPPEL
jgi:hypothetical protein